MKKLLLSTLLLLAPLLSLGGQAQTSQESMKSIKVGRETLKISKENYAFISDKLNDIAYDSMEMTSVYCEIPRYSHLWKFDRAVKGKKRMAPAKTVIITTRYKCIEVLNKFIEGESCKLEKYNHGWDITYCDK